MKIEKFNNVAEAEDFFRKLAENQCEKAKQFSGSDIFKGQLLSIREAAIAANDDELVVAAYSLAFRPDERTGWPAETFEDDRGNISYLGSRWFGSVEELEQEYRNEFSAGNYETLLHRCESYVRIVRSAAWNDRFRNLISPYFVGRMSSFYGAKSAWHLHEIDKFVEYRSLSDRKGNLFAFNGDYDHGEFVLNELNQWEQEAGYASPVVAHEFGFQGGPFYDYSETYGTIDGIEKGCGSEELSEELFKLSLRDFAKVVFYGCGITEAERNEYIEALSLIDDWVALEAEAPWIPEPGPSDPLRIFLEYYPERPGSAAKALEEDGKELFLERVRKAAVDRWGKNKDLIRCISDHYFHVASKNLSYLLKKSSQRPPTDIQLKSISIENFKGFGGKVTIPLRPITLLFGANSAGKSTILKSLAYFHAVLNTWRHPDRINISGQSVGIGDFKSAVHGHDETRSIRISVDVQRSWEKRDWASILESMFPDFRVESFRVQVVVTSDMPVCVEIVLDDELVLRANGFSIKLNPDSDFVRTYFLKSNPQGKNGGRSQEEPVKDMCHFILTQGIDKIDFARPWVSYADMKYLWSGMEERARDAYELCVVLVGALNKTLDSQRYIGPLRQIPDRHQRFKEIPPSDWYSGMAAWRELESIVTLGFPYVAHMENGPVCLAEEALREIRRLRLGYQPGVKTVFSVVKIHKGLVDYNFSNGFAADGSMEERSVKEDVKDLLNEGPDPSRLDQLILLSDEGVTVYPCDVGTGVSQALPIAIGAFAGGCSIMTVEQPELHLHPRLQCDLADVFVANIHRHSGRKFLIETHSEHLILRLLRRIRETSARKPEDPSLALTPYQVGVFYVEEAENGVRIQELRIGPDGQFVDEWPGGFFEEDFDEIVGGL